MSRTKAQPCMKKLRSFEGTAILESARKKMAAAASTALSTSPEKPCIRLTELQRFKFCADIPFWRRSSNNSEENEEEEVEEEEQGIEDEEVENMAGEAGENGGDMNLDNEEIADNDKMEMVENLLKKREKIEAKLWKPINAMHTELMELKSAHKILMEKKKNELAAAIEEIDALNAQNEHLKAENEEQKKEITSLQKSIYAEWENKKEMLNQYKRESQRENKQLRAEIQQMKKKAADEKDSVEALQNELANAKNLNTNIMEELIACREECSQIKVKTAQDKNQIATLDANLTAKIAELAACRNETTKFREKYEKLKKESAKIMTQFNTLFDDNIPAPKMRNGRGNDENNGDANFVTLSRQNPPSPQPQTPTNLENSNSAYEEEHPIFPPENQQQGECVDKSILLGATRQNDEEDVEITAEVNMGKWLPKMKKEGEQRPKEWPILTMDFEGNLVGVEESGKSLDGMTMAHESSNAYIKGATKNCVPSTSHADNDRLVLDPRPSTSGTQQNTNNAVASSSLPRKYALRYTITSSRDGLKRDRSKLLLDDEQSTADDEEVDTEINKKKKSNGTRKTQ